jgi:hypothetical protein
VAIPNGGSGGPAICNFRQSGTNFGNCGLGGESFTLSGCGAGPDCGPPVPEPSSIWWSSSTARVGRYTTKWWCHAVAGCWPVGSRTGAVFRRSSLAVAPRFLATQRDHKLRQHNLSVVSARDELRQTIAILGWQEHRWQKERLCNFGHLHHGGLQSGRVTCAMAIYRK